MMRSCLTLLFSLISASSAFSKNADSIHAIYGDDNRIEASTINDPRLQNEFKSIALLTRQIDQAHLGKNITLELDAYQTPDVNDQRRFADQISRGTCTAFLISPQHLITAAHCIFNYDGCKDVSFIFDFLKPKNAETVLSLHPDSIYTCKKVLEIHEEKENGDYAILELDRPTQNRTPLKLAKLNHLPEMKTPVYTIGFPQGRFMKYADHASVIRKTDLDFTFLTNLDGFDGNSGSPVFNAITHEVIGVYSGGADDITKSLIIKKTMDARYPQFPTEAQMTSNDEKKLGEEIVSLHAILPAILAALADPKREYHPENYCPTFDDIEKCTDYDIAIKLANRRRACQ